MIRECKILKCNELVMVIDFDGELVQMPTTKHKENLVYVRFEYGKYKISNKDEYDKSFVKNEKKEFKREK